MQSMKDKGFGSDNHCGVHPLVMEALLKANAGHAPSYGTDSISLHTQTLFQELFERTCDVFFVFNGTAANTLALQSLTTPFGAVLCTDVSHAYNDECGAPEKIAGCKLIPIKSKNGKLTRDGLTPAIRRQGDQHCSQIQAITITQPTELGTSYTIEELKTLCQFAREHHLKIHIDGARLNNAVAYLNCTHGELLQDIDVISFGGTKNGLMFGEAVIFFDTSLANDFKYIRKQGLNLPSKSRFIAAQFEAVLKNSLWKEIAHHENNMATLLSQKLSSLPQTSILYPIESNMVFAQLPLHAAKSARQKHFFYFWDRLQSIARLVCSFDTNKSDILDFTQNLERQIGEAH